MTADYLSTRATIDEILTDLNGSKFEEAFHKAASLAEEQLSGFWQKLNARLPNRDSYYPTARLLQAYALAGKGMRKEAEAVISEEVKRLRQTSHASVDFFLSHYIALAAAMARQNGVIADGLIAMGQLVGEVASITAKRKSGEKMVYEADLRDRMAVELGLNIEHQVAQASLGKLIGNLREKSYYLQTPVANRDYDMPKKTPSMLRIPVVT